MIFTLAHGNRDKFKIVEKMFWQNQNQHITKLLSKNETMKNKIISRSMFSNPKYDLVHLVYVFFNNFKLDINIGHTTYYIFNLQTIFKQLSCQHQWWSNFEKITQSL